MPPTLFVIRDRWEEISPKARFVTQIFRDKWDINTFYIVRNEGKKFGEQWSSNKVELATSASAIFSNYFLMMLKSPKDLYKSISRRLFRREIEYSLVNEGFISVISETLNQYFASVARSVKIIAFLKGINSPKIFLIDEFMSIRTLDIKTLKRIGTIIYVSQDVASEHFDFEDYSLTRSLMYKLEREILQISDLVIACSERDQFRYGEMGARNVVFYPNIYPIMEFEPSIKDKEPSVCIVFRSRWGTENAIYFNAVFEALSKLDRRIKVYVIGLKPQWFHKNIELEHYERIHSKLDYMKILSKSWIGINIGIHKGGTNERKYDYAMAGLVVFSDTFGCRGELLPREYTYLDSNDLAAKLKRFLELGQERIIEMGLENREQALSLAEEQKDVIARSIENVLPSGENQRTGRI